MANLRLRNAMLQVSSAKLRKVLHDKFSSRVTKCHVYAELLRRYHERQAR